MSTQYWIKASVIVSSKLKKNQSQIWGTPDNIEGPITPAVISFEK